MIAELRSLTISAIDNIKDWREFLLRLQKYQTKSVEKRRPQQLMFYYDHLNYLIKIRSDTHFINHSILNKYFPFSTKFDPFFVYPQKALE